MDMQRLILAIEVSNPGAAPDSSASVALGPIGGAEDDLIIEVVRMAGRGGNDDDLMPAIDRAFRRFGASPRDGRLARVAVSVGPGGYTSVRVACAAGKMIAAATGAECVGVPTALVALHGSLPAAEREIGSVVAALASKNDSAWMQVFTNGRPDDSGRVLRASDMAMLHAAGVRTLIADAHLPPSMRMGAESAGLGIVSLRLNARACARAGQTLAPIDPGAMAPLYPREPDAVTLWRARKA